MTIFGSGYRAAEYRPTGALERIWPIARIEVRAPLRSRWSVLTFVLMLGPNLGYLALLLILSGVWQLGGPSGASRGRVLDQFSAFDPAGIDFYLDPTLRLPIAFLVTLVVTTLVGSRAVARDVATNALEILWTRGVSPLGYFAGKWLGASMLLGIYTIAAPAVLWIVAFSTTENDDFVAASGLPMIRVLLALAAFTGLVSAFAVGFSTCFRRPNAASIAWALAMVGLSAVTDVFAEIVPESGWIRALGPWSALVRVTEAAAGVTKPSSTPLGPALLVLGVAAVLLGRAVQRRLRVTEAIA